ncbi:hypothetical protein EQO05_10010 [Methanosarcina sp. MSH10X1]|uniref:hypothetical protein n=1 Tax=Methanosarcina sp. MSH10X1 TaxID=2507075 RepID=UPI000FFC70ED|nr:hypothetical protein [Methanosarcina sp. MSH10X1]RXA18987.1 hypothetical protein EQO05_10010 [Methanosarcina sp. MSH10X1]
MRQRSIKKYLIGSGKRLQKERGNANLTARSRLAGLKSFYQALDIEIPELPQARIKAYPLKGNMDIHTEEQLQEVLKVYDPLKKAILPVSQ